MGDFTMPSLGADMEDGTLVEWLVTAGDTVDKGQIVAVVETNKGAIEIEVFEAGVVDEVCVGVGENVPVGSVLARIAGAGTGTATATATSTSTSTSTSRPTSTSTSTSTPTSTVPSTSTEAAPAAPVAKGGGAVVAVCAGAGA